MGPNKIPEGLPLPTLAAIGTEENKLLSEQAQVCALIPASGGRVKLVQSVGNIFPGIGRQAGGSHVNPVRRPEPKIATGN